ncbi:MAG: hypothetical protein A2Z37_00395 [Chloroflexi bacterium RBG_19FT_COMBO_62_14]|nr:MAG: hypothetical protein A2Z37_00395 [Chloroflexi bacterium RBG_19FT_COMBO_62_14]
MHDEVGQTPPITPVILQPCFAEFIPRPSASLGMNSAEGFGTTGLNHISRGKQPRQLSIVAPPISQLKEALHGGMGVEMSRRCAASPRTVRAALEPG